MLFGQAKPLLQQGATERLIDPRLKFTRKSSSKISRMVQAAAACINSDESLRPVIDDVITILRQDPDFSNNKISSFPSRGCIVDCCPQLQPTRGEMKDHLALAMVGVSDVEDDDHLYCR